MLFELNLPSFDTLLINSSAVFDKNWLASDNVLVRYLNVMLVPCVTMLLYPFYSLMCVCCVHLRCVCVCLCSILCSMGPAA